ncbi:MAG: hypothetical protein AAF581_20370 [Planctomycetota bacterium]
MTRCTLPSASAALVGLLALLSPMAATAQNTLTIEDTLIHPIYGGEVHVRMANSVPVEGYVLAISYPDNELTLQSVDVIGTIAEAVGTEFSNTQNFVGGVAFSVLLDALPPFDGQTIPNGPDWAIANFNFTCNNPPTGAGAEIDHALTFQDGVFGNPVVDNIIVSQFQSLAPALVNGTATCQSLALINSELFAGKLNVQGAVDDLYLNAGSAGELQFFYQEPDNSIQGVQISVEFDCALTLGNSFSIEDTVLDVINAEFVSATVDTDPNDGDPCELVIGILIDAAPPFNGQESPASATPLLLGSIDVTVPPTALPGDCFAVDFVNGADGTGTLPVSNAIIIGGFVNTLVTTHPALVCVNATYRRGDCNDDALIDLADGIFLLVALFGGGPGPGCRDACDTNSDSNIDLGDPIAIISYLFAAGPAFAEPFPFCGNTASDDCATFNSCP